MYDFSKQISSFHKQHVRLSDDQRRDMKAKCETNLVRIKKGLEELKKPTFKKTINQGGYAQKTMTQPPEADQESRYDIDLGIVFDQDDAKTPRTTRDWVCRAIARKATNMKNDPVTKKKCVRVVYADGYQCDFLVFRQRLTDADLRYEMSSGDKWIASDPVAMNQWVEQEVPLKSPESSGGYQLRRIIRMGKFFTKTHAARLCRSFPCGLVATALFIECYAVNDGRDDKSFRETLRNLSQRSRHSPVCANGFQVSGDKDAERIGRLIDQAKDSVRELDKLDADDTTDSKANKIWKTVFHHSFFEDDDTQRYNVSSYGWDSDVEGLVRRLERGDIYIPGFQRAFVWTGPEKSRFIESLILGLPVPNVFLAKDANTKSLNIVDGQQRLRSLRDFLAGKFYLTGKDIKKELRGCYFSREVAKATTSKVLSNIDARALADAVLHSIVIKPDPSYDDPELGHGYNQSVIQIFNRLNTSGNPLEAHEIRASIFFDPFDNLLRELNENVTWRDLYGDTDTRLKDMELILRVIALREKLDDYSSPMRNFLDTFMEENREIAEEKADELRSAFAQWVELMKEIFLHRKNPPSVSQFDSVMIGINSYLSEHPEPDPTEVLVRLEQLEHDSDYIWSTEKFTHETDRIKKRINRAKEIFRA